MNSKKSQKDMTLEDEPPRSAGIQYAAGEELRPITDNPRKKEAAGPTGKNTALWMCLVVKVKPDGVKNNVAWEPETLGTRRGSSRRWRDWTLTSWESVS